MKKWRLYAFQLMMVGSCLYVVLTTVAMITYTGGTYTDPSTRGYSFFNNFFSDLARTVALSGEPNAISWVLATTAFLLSGSGLILGYLAWPALFRENPAIYRVSIFGTVFGIISGIGFIGVAFTPWDLFLEAHQLFVIIGFVASAIAITLYAWVLQKQSDYPKRYFYSFVLLVALSLLYLIVLFYGPSVINVDGLVIQVTAQKIIIYSMGLTFFFQGYGAAHYWNQQQNQ